MSGQPAAFLSYVRFDDEHDDGQLTQFRERLSAEVRVQTGEDFPIFQDRNDIVWGQNWRARIEEALDAVTLLIPVITPGFLRSPACRTELVRFLERERDLGRADLIVPVYYISTPELDDPVRREADELAQALAARQFVDWRELRFEQFYSPVVRKALAQLANRLRESFGRSPVRPAARTASKRSRTELSISALGVPPPLMQPRQSAAFLSYVPFNDLHDEGQLTQFRERLSTEVRAQTGEEFVIFQERKDIAWGQNWKARIEDVMNTATLLIPVITPSFFHSAGCRAEVERFLARERRLGREDLILPVYYVSSLELDDPDRRDDDALARVLATRQYADWRELRFEPFTSPLVRKALAQLARRMQSVLTGSAPSAALVDTVSLTELSPSAPIFPVTHNRVFVSYSHKDHKLLGRLQTHLKPLERRGQLELWDDTRIQAGDKWRHEIREAIESCRVAILLISADFMASDFIHTNELPPLLNGARRRGVRIFSIIVGYSNFEDTELAQFEAVNNPSRPLWLLSPAERDAVFHKVYRIVKAALS
jgi:hypothetical protein